MCVSALWLAGAVAFLFLFPPFGPLPFGPAFRFRAKLTLAMVAKFATIWLERLFFLAAVSQGTCSLRMHARHLAVNSPRPSSLLLFSCSRLGLTEPFRVYVRSDTNQRAYVA